MSLGSENETVEFKKSTGERKEALQAISAMLNKLGLHSTNNANRAKSLAFANYPLRIDSSEVLGIRILGNLATHTALT